MVTLAEHYSEGIGSKAFYTASAPLDLPFKVCFRGGGCWGVETLLLGVDDVTEKK